MPEKISSKNNKKFFIMIFLGAFFTFLGRLIEIRYYSSFTVPALILILAINPIISVIIFSFLALIFSLVKKDVKHFWLPAFSWLFLIIGSVDLVSRGYNGLVVTPHLEKKFSDRGTIKNNQNVKTSEDVRQFENTKKPRDIFAENPEMLYNISYDYLHGNGVPKDNKKALEFMIESAEYGYAEAQYTLGYMYMTGIGLAQDKRLGVEWLTKAKRQGNENAIKFLSSINE